MIGTDDIVLGVDDAAAVTQLLLDAGRASDIPRYLRASASSPTEMVEAELNTARSSPHGATKSLRPADVRI